jgi:hypothetical protein
MVVFNCQDCDAQRSSANRLTGQRRSFSEVGLDRTFGGGRGLRHCPATTSFGTIVSGSDCDRLADCPPERQQRQSHLLNLSSGMERTPLSPSY